jgi:hypothetical protein
MPQYAWHEQKKAHNLDTQIFLATKSPTFIDWEIITLFYSALHYVDSFLSNVYQINFIPDHDKRKEYVSSLLPNLNKTYLSFYHLSQDARYDDIPIGLTELEKAKTYYEVVKHTLTPIECPNCGQINLNNKGKCEACSLTI